MKNNLRIQKNWGLNPNGVWLPLSKHVLNHPQKMIFILVALLIIFIMKASASESDLKELLLFCNKCDAPLCEHHLVLKAGDTLEVYAEGRDEDGQPVECTVTWEATENPEKVEITPTEGKIVKIVMKEEGICTVEGRGEGEIGNETSCPNQFNIDISEDGETTCHGEK